MISKEDKKRYRGELFRHLDGIAIAPVSHQFFLKGITKHLLTKKEHSLTELCKKFKANDGYLNVALRLLASQGWLVYEVNNKTEEVIIKLNENSEEAFALFKNYKIAIEFLEISRLFHPKKSTPADFYKTHKLINDFQNMKLDSGTNE